MKERGKASVGHGDIDSSHAGKDQRVGNGKMSKITKQDKMEL